METFNDLLLNLGDAVQATWDGTTTLFAWLFDTLSAVLNPILSPALATVNPLCTAIGDAVYALLSPLPVWLGLTVISALTGMLMLVTFKYLSNQKAIGQAKDDIKAQLLALKLYKDQLRVTFQAQVKLLWAILRLQRYVLTPVLWVTIPMLLALAQMGVRYQWRPLLVGEQTRITINLNPDNAGSADVKLLPDPGLIVEVGPIPAGTSLAWRVRAGEPGRHNLRFQVGDDVVQKELVVGDRFQRVSALRPGARWTDQLFHPTENRLPPAGPVRSIEIPLPHVDSLVYGADYWILYFFVVSMITALIFKPIFNVRF